MTNEQRRAHQLATAAVTACRSNAVHELAVMVVEEDQAVVGGALAVLASVLAKCADEHFAAHYALAIEDDTGGSTEMADSI